MGYKFVRITNYYPQYLKDFYANSNQSGKSYVEQHDALVADSVESASSFSRELNRIPGVQAYDIISNAKPLQDHWRMENHLPESVSGARIVLEQLKELNPQVVWVDDLSLVNAEWMNAIRKNSEKLKLLVTHICAPYNESIEAKLRMFDIVFSCIPCMVRELKEKGMNAYLLYHSFDAAVLKDLDKNNDQPYSEVLFTGSLYSGAGFHNERMQYLEAFMDHQVPLSLYCNLESSSKLFAKKSFHRMASFMRVLGLNSVLKSVPFLKNKLAYADEPVMVYSPGLLQKAKPPVFGRKLFQLMSRAKITFNNHGSVAGKCAGNIRMFEVTGAGSCLLTDWKENIAELFEPGKEIVTYTSVPDCLEKVNWLLRHPEECRRIAQAGHARTMREHTVEKRAALLNGILMKAMMN